LELLARGIIIESHVILGRPLEALHLFSRARPLFEGATEPSTRLRVSFLEARLLVGLGNVREAEKLFRDVYQAFIDLEMYKDAFVTLLSLFESQCERGALDKAARLCQTAIEDARQIEASAKAQVRVVWQKLLTAIQVGQLQKTDLEDARQFFVRYWNIPPKGGFRALAQTRQAVAPAVALSFRIPPRPAVPPAISPSSYEAARVAYDRELVIAALRETGGNISEASRRLGLSRTTLRARIREYGLARPE
jgi:transcriptional regulator with GAF, ATPase, and Fis domain